MCRDSLDFVCFVFHRQTIKYVCFVLVHQLLCYWMKIVSISKLLYYEQWITQDVWFSFTLCLWTVDNVLLFGLHAYSTIFNDQLQYFAFLFIFLKNLKKRKILKKDQSQQYFFFEFFIYIYILHILLYIYYIYFYIYFYIFIYIVIYFIIKMYIYSAYISNFNTFFIKNKCWGILETPESLPWYCKRSHALFLATN